MTATIEDDVFAKHPQLKLFNAYLDEFKGESDRGSVLVSAAKIDDLLKRSIKSFRSDCAPARALLEGFNAPLGTLSSRIMAAYAMGLIDNTLFHECQKIRKIRNAFAHDIHTSFNQPDIRSICDSLHYAAKFASSYKLPSLKFTVSAISVILFMTYLPVTVAKRRLQYVAPTLDEEALSSP